MLDIAALASWTRVELVDKARQLGVERPERMTRLELRDEIQRLTGPRGSQEESRGLLGTARSMIASMVEAGLNMPEAAAVIRGEAGFDVRVKNQPPVATVTLAEIYAAQGHRKRALRMLDDVLAAEPDHEVARELRERLESEGEARAPEARESAPGAAGDPFVDTTGEEIRTGKSPEVAPIEHTHTGGASANTVDADQDHLRGGQDRPRDGEDDVPGGRGGSSDDQDRPQGGQDDSSDDQDRPQGGQDDSWGSHDDPQDGQESSSDEQELAPATEPEDAEDIPAAAVEAALEPDLGSPGESSEPLLAEEVVPPEPEPNASGAAPRSDALFFRTGAEGTRLYWELSPVSLDRLKRRMPEGRATLRVVAMRPSAEGTARVDVDLPVEASTGTTQLEELHTPAIVRAALGWLAPEGFTPLAVATDLDGGYRPPVSTSAAGAEDRARDHLG